MNFFASLFDSIADAFTASSSTHDDGLGATSTPVWHNDFGTAADYQTPAESFSAFDDSFTSSSSSCFSD